MDTRSGDIRIDWERVLTELFEKERIPPVKKIGLKHIVHLAAERCIKMAEALVDPKILSVTKKIIKADPEAIEIEGGVRFSGRRMASYIKGSGDVCLFLVTLGERIEKEASRLMSKSEPLYGYLLDSIGSLAVESLAEAAEEHLRSSLSSENKGVSMRLSPGYCDWPIEEQSLMAKVLDFSKAGVILTQSCMMVPRKSISAMVGIGQKTGHPGKKSQCAVCDKKDCNYRRITKRA